MPEIKIKENTTIRDKVFFEGTAVLSDKAAKDYNAEKGDMTAADIAEAEAQENRQEPKKK